jgi:DNA polymerase-3 subunit epsilon
MLDWITNKNKSYPEFWKTYLSKFETKPVTKRFVILTTEKSGLNITKDVIFSIGAIAVVNDGIVINDNFDVVLLQYKYLHDNGLSNEFLIESKQIKLAEPQAIQAFVEYIGDAVLVGTKINFDIDMFNFALDKLNCGRLKNEALDIEIMYYKWKETNDKSTEIGDLNSLLEYRENDKLSNSEDAYSLALYFLKLKNRLNIK